VQKAINDRNSEGGILLMLKLLQQIAVKCKSLVIVAAIRIGIEQILFFLTLRSLIVLD